MTLGPTLVATAKALSTPASRKWRLALLLFIAFVTLDGWIVYAASLHLAAGEITAGEWAATARAVLQWSAIQSGGLLGLYGAANVWQKQIQKPDGGEQ